ncbi:MAG: 2OG-Fe(II) oxygenase [Hyphomicrobiaceae bacterium]|nr:2OG-Fe(II) oxygenase [Hyphomicrobiaceae bacterium]
MINLEAIWQTPVNALPFKYFVAENLFQSSDLEALDEDFPRLEQPGTFPLQEVDYGPAFARLLEQVRSRDFIYLIGKKLQINLTQKPLLVSVRGHSRLSDGRIHTDSKSRVVSCALYLNKDWHATNGRLRMLRNSSSYSRAYTEVTPDAGTLVALKRSDRSWHGHLPYEGPRRCLLLNWMWSRPKREIERIRHRVSSRVKRAVV